MIYLYGLSGIGLLLSFLADRKKTRKSLITAWKLFIKMLPMLLMTLAIVSVVLYFLPDETIARFLGTEDVLWGAVMATAIGSISLLPGFITFPLCGMLLSRGVGYTVLAAFTTSLMLVGIVTFPVEKKYFGTKLTIIRNIFALFIAVIISIAVGVIYGEVTI